MRFSVIDWSSFSTSAALSLSFAALMKAEHDAQAENVNVDEFTMQCALTSCHSPSEKWNRQCFRLILLNLPMIQLF